MSVEEIKLTEDELEGYIIVLQRDGIDSKNTRRLSHSDIYAQPPVIIKYIEDHVRTINDFKKNVQAALEVLLVENQPCCEDRSLLLGAIRKRDELNSGVRIKLGQFRRRFKGETLSYEISKLIETELLADTAICAGYSKGKLLDERIEQYVEVSKNSMSCARRNYYWDKIAILSAINFGAEQIDSIRSEYKDCPWIFNNLLTEIERKLLVQLDNIGFITQPRFEHAIKMAGDNGERKKVKMQLNYTVINRKKLQAAAETPVTRVCLSSEEKTYAILPDSTWRRTRAI